MNVRPATRDDLDTFADVFGSVGEAVNGRPSRIDAATVDGWLQTIAFETNTWLIEEEGEAVAGAFAQVFGPRGNCAGAVRPSAWGRGHGSRLVELIESRLAEDGVQRIHSWTVAGDSVAGDLLGGRGYRAVRRFWEMLIEFEDKTPEPSVHVEPLDEADTGRFHEALEESFADHWGHEPEPFDEWWKRQRRRANFDPSLWFVIRDGDEIAGVVRNEARPPEGWVGAIGVRPAWRGRGYGRALLLHSFCEFQRRGMTRAALGVDAANATGATHLYESVGMHAAEENVVWEKELG
jgi:mycothiol synthase